MKETLTASQRFLIRMENKLNHVDLKMTHAIQMAGVSPATISNARRGHTKKLKQETMNLIEMAVRRLTE